MRLPLCVDLDGTLVRTDLLYETLLAALRRRPWIVLALPFWLLAGRAHLKARLVEAAGDGVDIAALPLTEDLVDYLRSERQAGRRIELVSASDRRAVERVAARVGLFDAVFGSDGDTNLKGPVKARALVERHPEGFVYAGDARADLAVWEHAAGAIPVNAALARRDEVAARAPIEAEFGTPPRLGRALFKALRPHQWAKNALVLLPLLLTRSYELPAVLVAALATIALFSLAASGTYLLNDLLDLSADRTHPSKRDRPLASGALPIPIGLVLSPLLIAVGLAGTLLVDPDVFLALVAYLGLTLAYSFGLKTQPVVDVLTLGSLFTLRLLAGHLLVDGGVPAWLLVFCMAFFTSLALVKRLTEVRGLEERGVVSIPGRGYHAGDGPFVLALGLTAGISSVFIFIIYLVADPLHAVRLADPEWLWVVPAVLGWWVPRVWLLASRGEMHDDPVVFALKDRQSLVLGTIAVLAVLVAG
ncbi:membrane protein [Thalassobaculum fulvum]|uniref:Membrane protein n=1 Tax=Thalassobaculum fulvum TaxID=1633335 RepID=A0A918XWL3_9PROT|nr:UbiA family prenyltransferase [Thalassobaculum fulvum]GHD61782.1 membrane protein [Thalassobaculum fulvum]